MAQKTTKETAQTPPQGAQTPPQGAQTPPQGAQTPPQGGVDPVFDLAVSFVLADHIEGGYVNDARDPGGETNFGISKRAYPKKDIAKLTRDDAIAIYRRDYWEAAHCDEMPPKVAIAVFDCAVNQGVGAAIKLLQRAARVGVDGQFGPQTAGAVGRADEDALVLDFLSWRLKRYAFTANAQTYMRGWALRQLHLLRFVDSDGVAA